MAKAMLVMDMPESCIKCDFVNGDMCCCGLFLIQTAAIESVEGYTKCRPSWCPLKELPQKKEVSFNHWGRTLFANGYNACIDEILGDDVE